MQNFERYAFEPAQFLLPGDTAEMEKWAVVACDQFTTQPEYWHLWKESAQVLPARWISSIRKPGWSRAMIGLPKSTGTWKNTVGYAHKDR